MTPTPRLRWVQRVEQMHPFYRDANGGPALSTYNVLQQWYAYDIEYPTEKGEWRDIPLEAE